MRVAGDHIVRLENFEGPLDLLLHLIRQAEVEVTAIPISTIADQYLASLRGIEEIDLDTAGEFLVMAATLMELKSRTISPPEPGERGAEEEASEVARDTLDPRSELVQQLLAYKWCRDAAEALEQRRERWQRRRPAARIAFDESVAEAAQERLEEVEVEDLELYDLVQAYARIAAQVDFGRLGEHHVEIDETPIEEHMADVEDAMRRLGDAREAPLRSFFEKRSTPEVIGLFLAVLELVRQRRVRVLQDDLSLDVRIVLVDADAEIDEASAASAEQNDAEGGEPTSEASETSGVDEASAG